MSSKRSIPSSFSEEPYSKRSRPSSLSSQSIGITTSSPVSASTSTSNTTSPISNSRVLTLNASTLSDELFLEVFSYLSPWDLSMVERVDRHFLRLANDPLLWRRLYMTANPYAPSLRGSRSSTPSRRPSFVGTEALASSSSSSPTKIGTLSDRENGLRDIIPLPSRRKKDANGKKSNINWKEMFRISTNWSSGRSTLTPISTPNRLASDPQSATHASPSTPSASAHIDSLLHPIPVTTSTHPRTIIALLHPVILYATRSYIPSSLPEIQVFLASRRSGLLDPSGRQTQHQAQAGELVASFVSPGLLRESKAGRLRGDVWVTDISVDKQDESSRVYVGYSSGALSILTIDLPDVVLSKTPNTISTSSSPVPKSRLDDEIIVDETFFQPSPTVPPLSLPVISALFGSLLVTCTDEFSLSFYTIPDEAHGGKHHSHPQAQRMKPFKVVRSHTSWFPASISINPFSLPRPDSSPSSSRSDSELHNGMHINGDDRVVVSIGFTIPVYPDQWTVSIQQFLLQAPSGQSSKHAGANWTWVNDRILTALAAPLPFTYSFGSTSGVETRTGGSTEIGSVGKVSSLAMDGRWICLAGEDNRVQVFEMPAGIWDGSKNRGTGNATKNKMGEGTSGKKDVLVWKHTLWAHHAAVTSVSCLDGRCITADSTGRLLIWSLDQPFDPEGLSPLSLPLRSFCLPTTSSSRPLKPSSSSSSEFSSRSKVNLKPDMRAGSDTDGTGDEKDEAKFVEVLKPRFRPFVDSASSIHHRPDSTKGGLDHPENNVTLTKDDEERPDEDENQVRGKESIRWVGQDAVTVVTVSTARIGERQTDRHSGSEERIKIWAFDG